MAPLVRTEQGREALGALFGPSMWKSPAAMACPWPPPPTRRANWERMERASYGPDLFRDNVGFLKALREKSPGKCTSADLWAAGVMPIGGSGVIGPRGPAVS